MIRYVYLAFFTYRKKRKGRAKGSAKGVRQLSATAKHTGVLFYRVGFSALFSCAFHHGRSRRRWSMFCTGSAGGSENKDP